MNSKKKKFLLATLVLAIILPYVSASIIYYMDSSFSNTIGTSDIKFTSGADTSSISGTIGANGSSFTATGLPLIAGVEARVSIAVNITNTIASSRTINLQLNTEDFGTELTQLKVYLVEVDGTEHLAVELDGSGTATTSTSGDQTIPASSIWSVKIITEMDPTAAATSKTLSLLLLWS